MINSKIIYPAPAFYGLSLDGSHYAYLNSADFNMGTGDFQVDALLYVDPTMADQYGVIASKGVASLNSAAGWRFVVDKTNLKIGLVFNDGNASALTLWSNSSAFSLGSWFWAAVRIVRASSAYFYINGQAWGSGVVSGRSGSVNNTEYFKTGAIDASTYRLKGIAGFLRVRSSNLGTAWFPLEWDRLAWGLPRQADDFLAVWNFANSLTDLSASAYTLAINAGSASYATGYPSGNLSITLPYLNFGEDDKYIDALTIERAEDYTARSYLWPAKRDLVMNWEGPLSHAMRTGLFAAYLGGQAVTVYKDSAQAGFQALIAAVPDVKPLAYNIWSGSIELVQV